MKNTSSKKMFFSLLLIASVFLMVNCLHASEYNIYVDMSYDGGDSDGSSEKPFDSIGDAIEKAESGDKIYIKKGTYKEKITLSKKIKLYGESTDTFISGGVTMGDGTSMEKLTITGSSTGILIEKNANVSIASCNIQNSGGTGIDMQEGEGKLVLKSSKVYSNEKGFYIQRGNQIEISESSVYGNRQEGIDIRAKVSGTIKNNSIYNNKESGIEVIVGSSDLSISNNTIKSNSASGITAQFYSENKKIGQIKITSNKITKNAKYGITCGTPSGGNPSEGYWSKSLELKDNSIDNNKAKAIAGSCKLIEAVEAEEEKDNKIIEDPNAKELSEEDLRKEEEAAREKLIKEEEARLVALNEEKKKTEMEEAKRETEAISNKSNSLVAEIETELKKTEEISKLKKIFFGVDKNQIDIANSKLTELDASISNLEALQDKVGDENTKAEILLKIEKLKGQKGALAEAINKNNGKNGIFGWILNFFK